MNGAPGAFALESGGFWEKLFRAFVVEAWSGFFASLRMTLCLLFVGLLLLLPVPALLVCAG